MSRSDLFEDRIMGIRSIRFSDRIETMRSDLWIDSTHQIPDRYPNIVIWTQCNVGFWLLGGQRNVNKMSLVGTTSHLDYLWVRRVER